MIKEIITFSNHKGGVAKTYTTLQTAYELSKRGNKVLVVDGDPQCNATTNMGIRKNDVKENLYSLFRADICDEEVLTKSAILHSDSFNADVLPGTHMGIDAINKFYGEVTGAISSDLILKRILDKVKDDYDYIVIDSAPGITVLTNNILSVTTQLIFPSAAEGDAIGGLMDFVRTAGVIKEKINPNLNINGLLFTIVPHNQRMEAWIMENARKKFAPHIYIYETIIPKTAKANEARQYCMPALEYDENNKSGLAYEKFVDEMLGRLKNGKQEV